MSTSGIHPFLGFAWTIFLLLSWNTRTILGIPTMEKYFPEVNGDMTKITWAHAVNSQEKLQNSLKDDVMMIEADIVMGMRSFSENSVPIMAHPPKNTSDLTFDKFLEDVLEAFKVNKKLKKGIKLDFKQINVVKPVLKALKAKKADLNFPIWINADILQGPVNSVKTPVNAKDFISDTKKYMPNATISIGWTTRYGWDDAKLLRRKVPRTSEGNYTQSDVEEMLKVITDNNIDGHNFYITFPVRAGLAAQSIDQLVSLLGRAGPKSSLTIWSKIDDPVDMDKLRHLTENALNSRCYLDLPFSMESGPQDEIDSDDDHFNPEHNDDEGPINGSNLSTSSVSFISSLVMIGLAIYLF